jgi:hypothetical protein
VANACGTYMPLEDAEIAAVKKEWENIVLLDVEDDWG